MEFLHFVHNSITRIIIKLPWIFPGATLKFNGAPRNIHGNFTGVHQPSVLMWPSWSMGGTCRVSLQWRHNERVGVSNHQPHDCLFNRLFGRRSKKTSCSASLAFVLGIHRWPVNSPHKWPVTRKMFPLDDVIMRRAEQGLSQWENWLSM